MVAGFRCYTADGVLQLTDNQVYFRLEGSQSLPGSASGWSQYGNQGGSYRDVTFSGIDSNAAHMLALSSAASTWCKVMSTTATTITYRITRTSGQVVDLYLFSSRRPPKSGGQFRLYHDDGGCLVNNAYPIVRPMGVITRNGYSGVSVAGRKCAHVPQKQGTATYNIYQSQGLGSCTFNGRPAYQITNTTGWSETHCIATTGQVQGFDLTSVIGPVAYQCMENNAPPTGQTFSSIEWSCLIIDVTGM